MEALCYLPKKDLLILFVITAVSIASSISDWVFLSSNFSNLDIKNAAIAFTVMPTLIYLLIACYVWCYQSVYSLKGEYLQCIIRVFATWILASFRIDIGVLMVMFYTGRVNTDFIMILYGKGPRQHIMGWINVLLEGISILLKDFPLMIVKGINNTQTEKWQTQTKVFFVLSVISFIKSIFSLFYFACRNPVTYQPSHSSKEVSMAVFKG